MIRMCDSFIRFRKYPLHCVGTSYPIGGVAVLAAVLLVLVAGCGTGTYNQRMKDRLEELRKQSKFMELLDRDPYEISDPQAKPLGVYLRLPKGIVADGTPLRTGYVEDGFVVDERRVQPPFLKFRDFCLSYELFLKNEAGGDPRNKEQPVHIYFAVSDAGSVEQQEILDEIRKAMAEKFSKTPERWQDWETDWETVTVDTPDGGTIEWKRIEVEGPQLFDCIPNGGEFKPFDGRFVVYEHTDPTYHVVVAWRAPVTIDDQIGLTKAAEVSVGTLQIEPPPPSPEGDQPPADPPATGEPEAGT